MSSANAEVSRSDVRVGFIPLVDAAPLIVAARKGFAEAEGLSITLLRETSWATLRDRLAVGHLDAAHLLAPMAVADRLGLTPLPVGLVVPIALGHGGNTITLSEVVFADMAAQGLPAAATPEEAGRAFAGFVVARRANGGSRPVLAMVHPHSAHHYQLACWLAEAGVRPGVDVELVVVPPALMTAALAGGQIDGFCAGEPWGSAALAAGAGRIVATSARIWHRGPEKVLGVRAKFAECDPARLDRLVRAVYQAALWCDAPENAAPLAALLAEGDLIGQPEAIIRASLERRMLSGEDARDSALLAFARHGGTWPRSDHAAWIYAQMVRWGQATLSPDGVAAVLGTNSARLYERAIGASSDAGVSGSTRLAEISDAVGASTDARVVQTRIADYLASCAIRTG